MAFVGRDSLLCQITATRKSYHSTYNINGVYHSERNGPPVVPTRVGGQAHHENVQISVRHSSHLNLSCTKQLSTTDESFLSAFWAARPWTDRYLEWSFECLSAERPNYFEQGHGSQTVVLSSSPRRRSVYSIYSKCSGRNTRIHSSSQFDMGPELTGD